MNGSGHFCGMAEMISRVDYNKKTDVWSQDKWRGCFQVRWIYVKDVPNSLLRSIKLENNDNKPVTNSRDTQEIPFDKGKQVLKVFHSYTHTSSIFDDFEHYEKRQDHQGEPGPANVDRASHNNNNSEKVVNKNFELDSNGPENGVEEYVNDEEGTICETTSNTTSTNNTSDQQQQPKLVVTSS